MTHLLEIIQVTKLKLWQGNINAGIQKWRRGAYFEVLFCLDKCTRGCNFMLWVTACALIKLNILKQFKSSILKVCNFVPTLTSLGRRKSNSMDNVRNGASWLSVLLCLGNLSSPDPSSRSQRFPAMTRRVHACLTPRLHESWIFLIV